MDEDLFWSLNEGFYCLPQAQFCTDHGSYCKLFRQPYAPNEEHQYVATGQNKQDHYQGSARGIKKPLNLLVLINPHPAAQYFLFKKENTIGGANDKFIAVYLSDITVIFRY